MRHWLTLILFWLSALPAMAESEAPDKHENSGPVPIIGVSGANLSSKSAMNLLVEVAERGAYPILLKPTRKDIEVAAQLAHVNAIILAGNSDDINPADYGTGKLHPETSNEDDSRSGRLRSDHEYALLDGAFDRQIPLLGVCGGHQRLNVHRHAQDGGTLIQHVEGQNQYFQQKIFNPHTPVEFVRLNQDALLTRLLDGADQAVIEENSLHHQVIGDVRAGFRVAAVSQTHEGTIEAIEPDPDGPYADHPFLLGVQWHPEYEASTFSRTLLDHVVEVARAHAKINPVMPKEVRKYDRLSDSMHKVVMSQAEQEREAFADELSSHHNPKTQSSSH